ncbi:MAG: DUF1648 domain-containing protein [Acidimicrobiales bacterium]
MNRKQILVAMVLVVLAAAVLTAGWGGLPESVATHWGPSGAADGYTSKGWGLIALTLGVPVIVAVALGALMTMVSSVSPLRSMAGAVPVAFLALLLTLTVGLTVTQDDGGDAPTALVVAAAVVLGLIAGMISRQLADPPPPLPSRTVAPPADQPRLTGTGTPSWTGTARSGVEGWIVMALVAVLTIVLMVTGAWWVAFITAPAMMLVAANLNFDVTVGRSNIVVASRLRWPRLIIPLDEVASATAERGITAWKWGGFGLRARRDRTGIITRSGDGLDIERTDGHHLVITVDEPVTAAAAINSLAEIADAATD